VYRATTYDVCVARISISFAISRLDKATFQVGVLQCEKPLQNRKSA
jgi:hypothetical protein